MDNSNKAPYFLNSAVNEIRLEGHFCDAIIRAQDVSFHIHNVILAASSPYFRSLFSQVSPADKTYTFDVSPEIMQAVIDCCYTGYVSVTHENVDKLLKAATKFKIEVIQKACWSFLEEHLSSQNCIRISKTSEYSHALRDKAFTFLLDHFEEIANSSVEFLQLSCSDLEKILQQDKLYVRNENIVFEAILRWIAHSPEDRTRHFNRLFPTVRLTLLEPNYLWEYVRLYELVKNDPMCETLIGIAFEKSGFLQMYLFCKFPARYYRHTKYLYLVSRLEDTHSIGEANNIRHTYWPLLVSDERGGPFGHFPFIPPRSNSTQPKRNSPIIMAEIDKYESERFYKRNARYPRYLLLVSGQTRTTRTSTFDETYCICEAYDIHQDHATMLVSQRDDFRQGHGAVFLKDSVYFIGGHGNNYLHTMRRYDLATDTWHNAASMNECRWRPSVTVLDGYIYAMGGYDGSARLNSAERYDPVTHKWTAIAPMHDARCSAACTTLDGKVYICGGYNGSHTLSAAECYDPRTDKWTRIAPMTRSHMGHGVIAYAGCIYAVGGFSDNQILTIEEYHPQLDVWHLIFSKETGYRYYGIGLGIIDNRLFVVSGESIEVYDFTTGNVYPIHGTLSCKPSVQCLVVPRCIVARYDRPCGPIPQSSHLSSNDESHTSPTSDDMTSHHIRSIVDADTGHASRVSIDVTEYAAHDSCLLESHLSNDDGIHPSPTSDNTSSTDTDTGHSSRVSVNEPTTDHISATSVGTKFKPCNWIQNLRSSVFQMVMKPLKTIKNIFRTIFHRQSHLSSNSGTVLVANTRDQAEFKSVRTTCLDPLQCCVVPRRNVTKYAANDCSLLQSNLSSDDGIHPSPTSDTDTDTGHSSRVSVNEPTTDHISATSVGTKFKPCKWIQNICSSVFQMVMKPLKTIKNIFRTIFHRQSPLSSK